MCIETSVNSVKHECEYFFKYTEQRIHECEYF